jgi:hypothetical protein
MFADPEPKPISVASELDTGRLTLEVVVVLAATAILLSIEQRRRTRKG